MPATTLEPLNLKAAPLLDPETFLRDSAGKWLDAVREFRRWEYDCVLCVEPSAEVLAKHRHLLRFTLHLSRSLLVAVGDPEIGDRDMARKVGAVIPQLENSWEMIHNPMSDAEADAILEQFFPDAPRP